MRGDHLRIAGLSAFRSRKLAQFSDFRPGQFRADQRPGHGSRRPEERRVSMPRRVCAAWRASGMPCFEARPVRRGSARPVLPPSSAPGYVPCRASWITVAVQHLRRCVVALHGHASRFCRPALSRDTVGAVRHGCGFGVSRMVFGLQQRSGSTDLISARRVMGNCRSPSSISGRSSRDTQADPISPPPHPRSPALRNPAWRDRVVHLRDLFPPR